MIKKMNSFGYRFVAIVMAFITILLLGVVSTPQKAYAASFSTGGQAYAKSSTITVYKTSSFSEIRGYVSANEGFTVLEDNTTNYRIQYSTSSGTKEGYIKKTGVRATELLSTCLGYMNGNATVYYTDNLSNSFGTVFAGEYVSVLAKNGSIAYIEYNTSSGRKRGYISTANLTCYNTGRLSTRYRYDSSVYGTTMNYGSNPVRSGPSSAYPVIGSIGNENVKLLAAFEWGSTEIVFIEYNVSGGKKTGYVIWD